MGSGLEPGRDGTLRILRGRGQILRPHGSFAYKTSLRYWERLLSQVCEVCQEDGRQSCLQSDGLQRMVYTEDGLHTVSAVWMVYTADGLHPWRAAESLMQLPP